MVDLDCYKCYHKIRIRVEKALPGTYAHPDWDGLAITTSDLGAEVALKQFPTSDRPSILRKLTVLQDGKE